VLNEKTDQPEIADAEKRMDKQYPKQKKLEMHGEKE